jgi:hypothetical protein
MIPLHPLRRTALASFPLVVLWLLLGLEQVGYGQGQSQAAARYELTLPVTYVGLREALVRISIGKRVAFGIEVARGSGGRTGPRDSAPRLEYALDLTGGTVSAMLDRIVSVKDTTAGPYEWVQDNAVFSVRPVHFRNNRAVALNRVIARFQSSGTNVMEVLFDVHRLFNKSYASRPYQAKHMPERVRAFVNRPIAVSMTNVTVRSILNEIARQHGQMSWVAEYADAKGEYPGLKLSFVGFDSWTVSATANGQK